jgi:phage FluMu gp28-like protein
MNFSSLFRLPDCQQLPIAATDEPGELPIAADNHTQPPSETAPVGTCRHLPASIGTQIDFPGGTWFLPTQANWISDPWHLRIWEKSRQVGATKTDALDSVLKSSPGDARFDVWVTSRDDMQSRLYLEDCVDWAKILHLGATYLGVLMLDPKTNFSAHVLQFANGRRIYCLSSNPNALAGKRGHVKIDEFALHEDQRLLYRIAKPVTQWGGTLSIISTHRGPETLFNQIITDIKQKGNPMGWHLYSYPIQKAVEEGIVERINEKAGRNQSREQFLARIRSECIDEEQWLQEYCCTPTDVNSAFFSYELISTCTDPNLKLMTVPQLVAYCSEHPHCSLYGGVDVGRDKNLFVFTVGEKIGDVMWDRLRIELDNRPFGEMEAALYPVLRLSQFKRCCFDSGGNGQQLHERAQESFRYKVDGFKFTGPIKEKLAFALRADFEDRKLRVVADDALRSDLRALKKSMTSSGNLRLEGDFENSHCDRTWALALRQHAARYRPSAGGAVA